MEHSAIGHCVWLFFIGGIIGWLAGSLPGDRGFGVAGDVVIGIVGVVLGVWMTRVLGLSVGSPAAALLQLL